LLRERLVMFKRSWKARVVGGIVLCSVLCAAGLAAGIGSLTVNAADRWRREEIAALASLRLKQLPAAAPDPSNAVERLPAAVTLGKRLFFDPRFSRNGAVSCASCHDPGRQFQDDRPLAQALGTGVRRTMPIVGAGHSAWLFWDGRKDSLRSQALGPLEDALEQGGNRLSHAHLIQRHYRSEHEAVFGTMPDLTHLPPAASPLGSAVDQATWRALGEIERDAVSRVFANMGKAIAAYEKTLRPGEARFDRYIEGVLGADAAALKALTPQEKNGLRIFIGKQADCVSCHKGPLLTDRHFHNTGVPPRDLMEPDRGRAPAVATVQQDEFNCLGRFSDATPAACDELRFIATDDPHLEGAFKTPGLRNVALRPPYIHAGQIASLHDVVRHYVAASQAAVGHTERNPLALSAQDVADLVAFLGSLSSPIEDGSATP
jgi:cytochrome c peroxidase